ncbi:MAG: SoxR reducing system RseC family protein [Muribaculaceae bacterium]|nr:SoxR reducing system RseC family protein [Muribaculaceae bacterium]
MAEVTEYIEHSAIIKKIDELNGIVSVRIDDPEECGDCPASKLCTSKGEPSTLVDIKVSDPSQYKVDDMVTVRGTERMHHKAIMYATVFPCIILVATMVGIYLLTMNQLAAALSGIGMTGLFYLILWLCRDKIAHEFTFAIVGHIDRAGEMK